jgi:ABC-type nitrate/sulfonate/bicarbonate transport system permease component
MTPVSRRWEWSVGAVPIVLLLAIWHGITAFGLAPPSLLPPPLAVFARLGEQLRNPLFIGHAGVTLLRLFAGFSIAVALGVGLGLLATASPLLGTIVRPLVRVLAPVPKVALYPAFILVLGFEHASKIALVAADATFPILLATWAGTAAVEPRLGVVLMAAMPSVLTGCRIGLVISCIVVFLAEMITSSDGLGHLLVRASRNFQTIDMFVPLITISLLGLALNVGFNALRRRLLAGFAEAD